MVWHRFKNYRRFPFSATEIEIFELLLFRPLHVTKKKVVSRFNCWSSIVTNSGVCEEEIPRRPTITGQAMDKLTKIWEDIGLTKNTKFRVVPALVFAITTYAAETSNH